MPYLSIADAARCRTRVHQLLQRPLLVEILWAFLTCHISLYIFEAVVTSYKSYGGLTCLVPGNPRHPCPAYGISVTTHTSYTANVTWLDYPAYISRWVVLAACLHQSWVYLTSTATLATLATPPIMPIQAHNMGASGPR